MRRLGQDDVDQAQAVRADHDCADGCHVEWRPELVAESAANAIDRRTLRRQLVSRLGKTLTAEVDAWTGDHVADIVFVAAAPATSDRIGESRDDVSGSSSS